MATKDKENSHNRDSLGPPEDAGSSTDNTREKTPPKRAEVASKDSPADADRRPPATTDPPGTEKDRRHRQTHNRPKRLSTIQKALIGGILAIVAMMLYVLFKPPQSVTGGTGTYLNQTEPGDRQTIYRKSGIGGAEQAAPKVIEETGIEFSSRRSLSLKLAEELYLDQNYGKAYAIYSRLSQNLPAGAKSEEDFLRLQMARCADGAGDISRANELLEVASRSPSPVVRVIANCNLATLDIRKKQYLNARIRAYRAIALIQAIDLDNDLASSLKRNCHFRVAESLTRKVLSLSDSDANLPPELWAVPPAPDPFANLSQTQLQALLSSGSDRLGEALLGPQVHKAEQQGYSGLWSVVANRAPLEELLSRFAANADLDISWTFRSARTPEQTDDAVRKRPVTLCMTEAAPQQFITVATGSAGLMATFGNEKSVDIFDPTGYSNLSEHIDFLAREAVSLWQRFLMASQDDERASSARFALALLHARQGRAIAAVAEYKLLANRYSQTPLACHALLYASRLKTALRDYVGARQDLKHLIEQHSDSPVTNNAYLCLADTTVQAGLKTEAARLYRKVYNLSLSWESQSAAALGAGTCFYDTQDYESAATWLTRYINLAGDNKSEKLYSACFLLGKANLALGKSDRACEAFRYALAGQLSTEQHLEAVSALVEVYMQQRRFVPALDLLEAVNAMQLSQAQSAKMLLLRSSVLRAIGLADKAVAALGAHAESARDPQLKARLAFELACYDMEEGNLESAHKKLTQILADVEPGPLAHQVGLRLADVCLKIARESQAVSICLKLLDSDLSSELRQETLKVLAAAYERKNQYDRATLALLGQWK
ncbi:MAG: tetratricopeptide repeat protein [Phycisphaerales bacterium]|nr:MAG: tetratricopeptide repeat protein [Phycisphaerales bacterium]